MPYIDQKWKKQKQNLVTDFLWQAKQLKITLKFSFKMEKF